MLSKPLTSMLCVLLYLSAFSQDKTNASFGNISPKDFEKKNYSIDSGANAIILADVGSSKLEGTNVARFALGFKRYVRIHVLNKNGYDAANFAIRLYSNGREEETLDKLKAVSYNLEDGKVKETKLDIKANVFKEKYSRNTVLRKFTLPNVKEGTIIEVEYTILSDFLFNLQSWRFQHAYPCLWSEYQVDIPMFLDYIMLQRGNKKYDFDVKKIKREVYLISNPNSSYKDDSHTIEVNIVNNRWVMKNVPALREESYTTTTENYMSRIDFQLSEQFEPLEPRKVMISWPMLSKALLEHEDFGMQVFTDKDWMNNIVDPLMKDSPDQLILSKRIYEHVRNNYTCTNNEAIFIDQSLRSVVKKKAGNVAELNLLLTGLLRYAAIMADPVILSTRSNGRTYSEYPVVHQYNYLISRISIGNKVFYLDASEPGLAFGRIPLKCYNGYGRVISEKSEAVQFLSSSLEEVKNTTVFISNKAQHGMTGTLRQTPGYYESLFMRNRIREKGQAGYIADAIAKFPSEMQPVMKLDSLSNYDVSIDIAVDFVVNPDKDDIIYFNPMLAEGLKENPFKSAQRNYPVEMPFITDNTYNFSMEVPTGFVVDELPKSVLIKINNGTEGFFEYSVSQSGNMISLRSRLKIVKTDFQPDEYEMLREFFSIVVKKHSEQIVFKKKVNP